MAINSSISTKFICLGEALLDRLSPLGESSFDHDLVDDCLGGAPANVACGLAKLGAKVSFCGRVGSDAIGTKFRSLMDQRNIELVGLQVDQKRSSRIVLVKRDLQGERSFHGFDGNKGEGFSDQFFNCDELQGKWHLISRNASWLLVGTIPLASSVSAKALFWTVKQALESDIKIALDINWRATFWDLDSPPDSGPASHHKELIFPLIEKASLLKLAKEEAIWFFNSADASLIANSLPLKPVVVITDGSNPICWSLNPFSGKTKAFSPSRVIDTTGAGDAFTAGLLYQLEINSLSNNQSVANSIILFAAACGALVCSMPGAIDSQPNYQEVERFLLEHSGGLT